MYVRCTIRAYTDTVRPTLLKRTVEKEYWLSHRLAWFLTKQTKPIQFLLHSCDTPRCVNPAHLREGTYKENSDDKVSRNRQAKGEKNGLAKLTEAKVLEILELLNQKVSHRKIGLQFNVDAKVIWNIFHKKSWKHIDLQSHKAARKAR